VYGFRAERTEVYHYVSSTGEVQLARSVGLDRECVVSDVFYSDEGPCYYRIISSSELLNTLPLKAEGGKMAH